MHNISDVATAPVVPWRAGGAALMLPAAEPSRTQQSVDSSVESIVDVDLHIEESG